METIIKRSVTLLQRIKTTPFAKLNNEVYGGTSRLLGASQSAENFLLANNDFLSAVMPTIIGLSPKSSGWQKAINNYLYSVEINVPKGGKILDISLKIDTDNDRTKANIEKLAKEKKQKFETAESIYKYLTGHSKTGKPHFEEIDLIKFATPVNYLDYFIYIYCLYHNRVANKQELVSKSPRIEFYLVRKEDIEEAKKVRYNIQKRVRGIMFKIEEDDTLFENICSILRIEGRDNIDKALALNEYAKEHPNKIIDVFNDKNLNTKALIERYVASGILKRIPGSSLITDAVDTSIIIGNTLEQAVTFFNNKENESILSQYAVKYQSLNK